MIFIFSYVHRSIATKSNDPKKGLCLLADRPYVVILRIFHEFVKSDKTPGLPSILSLFAMILINLEIRMIQYQMTLKLI